MTRYGGHDPARGGGSDGGGPTQGAVGGRIVKWSTGFEPQYAELVFGVFQRLEGERESGSGLGLPICRKIVERFGGRIWATATPGEGAVFTFTLPVEAD
ncbi:MAG: ATP-binding protein [Bryobacteraceae bacterium]|nr:ATP-binding protein [Bryobacteraceae bacterium]